MYQKDLKEKQQVYIDMMHLISNDKQQLFQKSQLLNVIRMIIINLGCWHVVLEMVTGNPAYGDDASVPADCGT